MSQVQTIKKGEMAALVAVAAGVGVLAAGFIAVAGVAAGMAVAGGPATVMAGAVAMGAVGGIVFAGAAGGFALAVKKAGSGGLTGMIMALAMGAVALGGGLAGFETGKSLQGAQEKRDAAVSVPVGKEARKALDALPDRGRVVNEIGNAVREKLDRESREAFNLCVQNRDYFRYKGVECDIYKPSAPAP